MSPFAEWRREAIPQSVLRFAIVLSVLSFALKLAFHPRTAVLLAP